MVRTPFSGILKGKGLYSNSIRENGKKRTSFIVDGTRWNRRVEWNFSAISNTADQNCSFGTLTAQQGAVIAPRQRPAYRSAGLSSACRAKTMSPPPSSSRRTARLQGCREHRTHGSGARPEFPDSLD